MYNFVNITTVINIESSSKVCMKKNLPTQNVEEIVSQITTVWNKAAEYIIEVSKILHRYKSDEQNQKLWLEIRDTLVERKIMSKAVVYNLAQIGSNQLLTSNVNKLPPAYNTLYLLTTLPQQELEKRFEDNQITPELKLEDIRNWKKFGFTIDNDSGDIEDLEIEEFRSDLKRGITIYFNEEDIVHKYEAIEHIVRELQSEMKYAQIELSGLLKRKIEGD